METASTKSKIINREWRLFDVQGKILGRSAVKIAAALLGKTKPYYVAHLDCGDYAVVINAKDIKVSGKKEKQKIYTRYSGYPGGLKKKTLEEMRAQKPEEIIRRAVAGMLPKNKLLDNRLGRLHIYAGESHSHKNKFVSEAKNRD